MVGTAGWHWRRGCHSAIPPLPVSILIGEDGPIQGIYKGTKLEVKMQLRADLETLLKGKAIIR